MVGRAAQCGGPRAIGRAAWSARALVVVRAWRHPARLCEVLRGCASRLCFKAVLQGCASRLCFKAVLQG
eukprot:6730556-Prymnesium_polylepis.1